MYLEKYKRILEDTTPEIRKEVREMLDKLNEESKIPKPPLPKPPFDWSNVIATAEYEVQSIINNTYHEDNDNNVYLAETVYKTIYGKDYYKWRNKMVK